MLRKVDPAAQVVRVAELGLCLGWGGDWGCLMEGGLCLEEKIGMASTYGCQVPSAGGRV